MVEPMTLEQRRGQPALVRRVRVAAADLPRAMRHAFAAITAYLAELDEQPAGLPFAAYHSMDLDAMEVEMGFPVARPLPGNGELEPAWLPGGAWAKALYTGLYAEIGPAHEALAAWVAEQGHTASGVAYEFYPSGPGTPLAETRTWVMMPLKAGAAPSERAPHPPR